MSSAGRVESRWRFLKPVFKARITARGDWPDLWERQWRPEDHGNLWDDVTVGREEGAGACGLHGGLHGGPDGGRLRLALTCPLALTTHIYACMYAVRNTHSHTHTRTHRKVGGQVDG